MSIVGSAMGTNSSPKGCLPSQGGDHAQHGALPTWPHSSGWGYYPSGGIGLIVIILIILLLMGRI